ncbi:hypothetical protein AWB68_07089 [Caballeronia choica]|uniref:Uncharacterized protein n=1 Tax=Caballeronia choica TaxID=326476 RepID=A0A158KRY7_9BURK|nr:hypothetical protein AWB68_07089 [Caballeronia choica]
MMTESMKIYLEGQIVENDVEFTLVELCRASGASGKRSCYGYRKRPLSRQVTSHQSRVSVARR